MAKGILRSRMRLFAPLVALALALGCRQELPELFDRNLAPETYVTAAPVESLFDSWRVRLHWYGRDSDGAVAYYLWAWTDSSEAYYTAWNPETNAEDRILRDGDFDATHLSTVTDTTFILKANDNNGTSRDMTFNIIAVDDQGKRDPVPARLYFTASVDRRPRIVWIDEPPGHQDGPDANYAWVSAEPETIPTGQPFMCSFTGVDYNGGFRGFQWSWGSQPGWFPQDANADPLWSYDHPDYGPDELAIVLRFNNDITGADADMIDFYRLGLFPIKAKTLDEAGVQSDVQIGSGNLVGAIAPILNRDPDTRLAPRGDLLPLLVTYKTQSNEDAADTVYAVKVFDQGDGWHYRVDEPIPWGEDNWVEFVFQGWDKDDPLIAVEHPVGDQDSIQTRFQISYTWQARILTNMDYVNEFASQGRFPAGGRLGYPEVLNMDEAWGEAGQYFRINVAPFDYTVQGYAIDHFGRVDGTPTTVQFTGGFHSLLDQAVLTVPTAASSAEIWNPAPPAPVRVELQPSLVAGNAGNLFAWSAGSRTATLRPVAIEITSAPVDTFCIYRLSLQVFGHDDPRNGASTQLGRHWWDLLDPDYPGGSSQQYSDDGLSIYSATAARNWEPFAPSGGAPEEDGDFTIVYQMRCRYADLRAGAGNEPAWLGAKTLTMLFVNTIESQNFEEKIEGEIQRDLNFVSYGRLSPLFEIPLTVAYPPAP